MYTLGAFYIQMCPIIPMSTCCKSSGCWRLCLCALHIFPLVVRLCRKLLHERPETLFLPELRQVSVQPATVSSVVQMCATVFCTCAARCPSTLTSSIAAWACAGCRSPSGSEYSGVCCWDCAEGRRGPSLDEGNKSFVLLNPPQCEKLWRTRERV